MKKLFLALLVSSFCLHVYADTISTVISKKPIRLYATSEDTTPLREIAPEDLTKALPLPVMAEEGERIKLSIEQKPVWASSIGFKINRECKTIARVTTKNTRDTAAIRGVGNEGGCTK